MNQYVFLWLLLSVLVFHVKGQSTEEAHPGDAGNGFQPRISVVIGILCVMFSLTFILLIYAKLCHRYHSSAQRDIENHRRQIRLGSSFSGSGIDKNIIESLPFFRFSRLRGTREGLEFAVCLSKFEDIEMLRLLPKCKHAFHIDCIDHWLVSHSSCPLCRQKVSAEDPSISTYSNSLRFLSNPSEPREDSGIELFVQREETREGGSSRFYVGSSFQKMEKVGDQDMDSLIRKEAKDDLDAEGKFLHKHNHMVIVSDVVFKHRWSNVSSSDLMFLNSEMLNVMSSNTFTSMDSSNEQMLIEREKIKNIESKRLFESKASSLQKISVGPPSSSDSRSNTPSYKNPIEKRSMSEITTVTRFGDSAKKNRMLREIFSVESGTEEARTRQLWLSIARRTIEWFAKKERLSSVDTHSIH